MSGLLNPFMVAQTATAYRYYRVLATAASYATNDGGYVFSVFTLSGYASADGTGSDVFSGKTATASQGSGSGAVDGNDATEWSTGPAGSAQWIYVDMGGGNTTAIHSIKILGRDPYGGGNYAIPPTANFQGSNDASAWTTLSAVSLNNNGSSQGTYDIP